MYNSSWKDEFDSEYEILKDKQQTKYFYPASDKKSLIISEWDSNMKIVFSKDKLACDVCDKLYK